MPPAPVASRPRRSRGARLRRAGLRLLAGLLVLLFAAFAVGWAVTAGVADAEQRVAARLDAFGGTPSTGEVPQRIAAALLATEDSRFGSHPGIDWRGALRAPLGVVLGRDLGGSTIQHQLARVLYEDGATDAGARARSVVLAVKLDQAWRDEQLLRMYLDAVYFGHGFYGVQAAAEGYFGLAPEELDWAQATVLVGLVQAPSAYDPFEHPERAAARQAHVLDRLVAVGTLSRAEADGIAAEPWHLTGG
ncbi:biosynthetic peptidoglycan transglycosylase [Blastococcus sp. BMG 814]|uniref:Biosynthetic peptidoglycan transglycosylase n=1 Tax=Blastococcus carthaginiensis TaxID=3050034 RepID=A0ABT9IB04_9ACTN|nr:biosynthetic peptidoglycan transglycosylase [Blastococcus carthaginiensis]MDP5182741.1 biosynthetic peptidoglycan transglycosylase [Blastococcus carthaginiensis]